MTFVFCLLYLCLLFSYTAACWIYRVGDYYILVLLPLELLDCQF